MLHSLQDSAATQCPAQVIGDGVETLLTCVHTKGEGGGVLVFPSEDWGTVLVEDPSQSPPLRGEESFCSFIYQGCQSGKQRCCQTALLRSSLN